MSGSEVTNDLQYLMYFWIASWIAAILSELTRLSPLLYYLIFGCLLGEGLFYMCVVVCPSCYTLHVIGAAATDDIATL